MNRVTALLHDEVASDSAAIEWAGEWADKRGGEVLVAMTNGTEVSGRTLHQVTNTMARDHSGVRVETSLSVGLRKVSQLVVVGQHPDPQAPRQTWLAGVVADVGVPVMVIPAGYRRCAEQTGVVLGVPSGSQDITALTFAVRAAVEESTALHLIRVWCDTDWFFSMTIDQAAGMPSRRTAAAQDVALSMKSARQMRPSLRLTGEVQSGELWAQLRKASARAELVVVGTEHGNGIALWLARNAACPVAVLPIHSADTSASVRSAVNPAVAGPVSVGPFIGEVRD